MQKNKGWQRLRWRGVWLPEVPISSGAKSLQASGFEGRLEWRLQSKVQRSGVAIEQKERLKCLSQNRGERKGDDGTFRRNFSPASRERPLHFPPAPSPPGLLASDW